MHDIRWKQRFSNLEKAFGQLTEFIEKGELNKFELQGLIQCFEYTYRKNPDPMLLRRIT